MKITNEDNNSILSKTTSISLATILALSFVGVLVILPAIPAVHAQNATTYTLSGLSLDHTCNPTCADLSTGSSFGWNEGDWWPAQLAIAAGTGSGAVDCVSSACTITINLDYHDSNGGAYGIDAFASCGPVYPDSAVTDSATQDSAAGQCGTSSPPTGPSQVSTNQYTGGDTNGNNGPGNLYHVLVCDSTFTCSDIAASMISGSWVISSSAHLHPYVGEADQAIAFTLSVGPFAAGSVHYIEWANHLAVTGVCTFQGDISGDCADTLGASYWQGHRLHMNSDLQGVTPGVRDVPIGVGPFFCEANCGPNEFPQPPSVTKDAVGSYNTNFVWSITKQCSFDGTTFSNSCTETTNSNTVTIYYQVTVTHDAGTITNVLVSGAIDVFNPNYGPMTANITDTLSDGTDCTATITPQGSITPITNPVTLASGDNIFDYSCTPNTSPSGLGLTTTDSSVTTSLTNTVSVSWDTQDVIVDGQGNTGSLGAGSTSYTFPLTGGIVFTNTIVDDSVTVTDSNMQSVTDSSGTLGTASALISCSQPYAPTVTCTDFTGPPAGTTFSYSVTYGLSLTCPGITNTATFTTDTSGKTGSAYSTVSACPGGVFNTAFCSFGSSFNLVYTSNNGGNTYKLDASNPGQFYYIVTFTGTPGSSFAAGQTLKVPYPFTTGSASFPIQTSSTLKAGTGGNCFNPAFDNPIKVTSVTGGTFTTSKHPSITLTDYGTNPTLGTTQVTITLGSGTFPASGVVIVTVHLQYGLKDDTFTKSGTSAVDQSTTAGHVFSPSSTIANGATYTFSNSATGNTVISSVNLFKNDPGIAGVVQSATSSMALSGVTVTLYGSTGKLLATTTTDSSGYYSFKITTTGTYTVKLPAYGASQSVKVSSLSTLYLLNFNV
jgi:SdrD B-like domain